MGMHTQASNSYNLPTDTFALYNLYRAALDTYLYTPRKIVVE